MSDETPVEIPERKFIVFVEVYAGGGDEDEEQELMQLVCEGIERDTLVRGKVVLLNPRLHSPAVVGVGPLYAGNGAILLTFGASPSDTAKVSVRYCKAG